MNRRQLLSLIGLGCAAPLRAWAGAAEHRSLLDEALAAAGGLGSVRRGDSVLLKVNSNSGDPYPYSTSGLVVGALAARLADAGAKVFVGDRSFWGDQDTLGNFERNGIAAAARAASANLVAFEDETTDWVAVDEQLVPSWRPPVRLPRLALEADHVFNLACAKTHFITGCTLGLKNLLGLVRAEDRSRPGNLRSHHPQRIHHQIAQLHRLVTPRLTIIDGFDALVSGGPTPASGAAPTIVRAGVVLAGRDRLAVEAAGIALLQRHAPTTEAVHLYRPEEHPTLVATREALASH